MKEYKKNPQKFSGRPKLPKYKDKVKGRSVVTYTIQAVGHNKEWKQEVNAGKRNNQNFVSIPFNTLINQLKYKGMLQGISVIETEESYTSKCSFTMSESLEHHEHYLGTRRYRGLYVSNNVCYNADVNGALNMIRKVIPTFSVADYGIQGVVVHPVKVTL